MLGAGSVRSHAVAVAVDVHRRNAKLVLSTVLKLEGGGAGLYSRPEVRLKGNRLPAVRSDVSSNKGRSVK